MLQLSRLVSKGSAPPFVGDLALAIDQLQAIRESAVGSIHLIVDGVHEQGHRQMQRLAAFARREVFGFRRFGLIDNHPHALISTHLPTVGGMRLADIHGIDIHLILIAGIEPVEDPSLGSKGSSREAAENENDRFAAGFG